MFQYRVTKYNPRFRDATGAFTRDDWISMGDVGSVFDGRVLTPAEYLRVENAYVSAAIAFLTDAGVESLVIADLENPQPLANVTRAMDECYQFRVVDLDAQLDFGRYKIEIWDDDNDYAEFTVDSYELVPVDAAPVA